MQRNHGNLWISKYESMDPSKDQMVCSFHFVDDLPTPAHPDSEVTLGYEQPEKV